MPIIPTLNQPGAIKPVPDAVLDRQKRPTADRSAEIAAVGNLGKASQMPDIEGDFAAPYRALGAVGEAVMQAGNVMGALALKRRQAETDVQVATAGNQMESAFAEHSVWRTNNPDPSGWQENLKQTLERTKQSIASNDKLNPAARQQIDLNLSKFMTDAAINTEQDSAKQTFRLAASTYQATVDRAIASKNYPLALEKSKEAEQKGYFFPHETSGVEDRISQSKEQDVRDVKTEENLLKAKRFTVAQNLAVSVTSNRGEAEALKALEDGKYGQGLDPVDKEKVRNSIQQVARDRSAAVMDDVSAGILTGQINNTAALDAMQSPFLTPKLRQAAKEYMANFDAYKVQQDKEQNGVRNAVEMRRKVKDYDPSADPDRTGYFTLLNEVSGRVEQSAAGEITSELYRKYGTTPPKLKVRPEIEQNVSKSLDLLFDPMTGAIPWRKESLDADKKKVVTEDLAAKQRALDAQTTVEMKMNDWFRENPQDASSLPKVRAKLQELLPEGTRAAALQSLMPAKPPTSAGPLDDSLINSVKELESFIPRAYSDYKQDSVGYGTRAKSADEVLTEAQADARLREELAMHAGRVDSAAAATNTKLTKGQRNALISFDFNTGRGAHLLETSGGDMKEVKRRLQLYTKAGGEDLPGLIRRREKEASIFDQ